MKRIHTPKVYTRLLAFFLTLIMLGSCFVLPVSAYLPDDIDETITGATVVTEGGTYLIRDLTLSSASTTGIIRVETEEPVALILDGADFITEAVVRMCLDECK